jgi:hypothetical protein
MLLREHRFKLVVGAETRLLVIEELAKGLAVWPHKFRLKLPASAHCEARTFYASSCYEVAEKAADYLAGSAGQRGIDHGIQVSLGTEAAPPRILQIQE